MRSLLAAILLLEEIPQFAWTSTTASVAGEIFHTGETGSVVANPSPPAPSCGNTQSLCPTCDGHTAILPDNSGQQYVIECNRSLSNAEHHASFDDSSGKQCTEVCNALHAPNGCAGVIIQPNGTCIVATAEDYKEIKQQGSAFLFPYTSPGSCDSAWPPPPSPEHSECTGNTPLSDFCPACNNAVIRYSEFGMFWVRCGFTYTNVTWLVDEDDNTTAMQCILACMYHGSCQSVVSPDGKCLLAISDEPAAPPAVKRPGYALFVPEFIGALIPCGNNNGHEVYANSTQSTETSPHRPTATSDGKTSKCQASDISCPDCDGAHVIDALGKTYHVLCGNRLFSEKNYAVQRWLTPEGCLAECDNFTWCGGSTFWPEGNCELARGEDVFPQKNSGYTAFLPVDLSYTAPLPVLSAYPTGSFTSPAFPSAVPTATEPTIISSRPPTMSHHSMGQKSSMKLPHSFPPATLVSTVKVTPLPPPSEAISLVACPAYNNFAVIDPTDDRHFNVQCDAGFEAESHHIVSADNFAACAASCTRECGGIQFSSTTRCRLFTSISVVSSAGGATAGVYIPHPGSSAFTGTTVTGLSVTESTSVSMVSPTGLA